MLNTPNQSNGLLLTHLKSRHLDTSLHHVWLDEKDQVAILPVFNLCGQMLGYQQYRPKGDKKVNNNPKEGRYFTRVLPSAKEGAYGPFVWGMESFYRSNTLFVTEGLFDAARLTNKGCAAVAVFANDVSKPVSEWLKLQRKIRLVVTVCDNDAAGKKLAKYGSTSHTMEGSKDLGDADDNYVDDLIKEYCL